MLKKRQFKLLCSWCVGKNEFVRNKATKQKVQRRYRLDTLRNLHKEYKSGNVTMSESSIRLDSLTSQNLLNAICCDRFNETYLERKCEGYVGKSFPIWDFNTDPYD